MQIVDIQYKYLPLFPQIQLHTHLCILFQTQKCFVINGMETYCLIINVIHLGRSDIRRWRRLQLQKTAASYLCCLTLDFILWCHEHIIQNSDMLDKLYLSVCSIFILKRLRHRGKTSCGCCSKVKPIRSTEKTFITLGIWTCHKDARTCHVLHCIVARFFFTQS